VSLSDLITITKINVLIIAGCAGEASIEANERQGTFSWGKLGQQFEGQGGL
jgi:hypothetical protein